MENYEQPYSMDPLNGFLVDSDASDAIISQELSDVPHDDIECEDDDPERWLDEWEEIAEEDGVNPFSFDDDDE